MALILADRVKETTITSGTGSLTLSGATFGGFQTFADSVGDGNSTYYCIQNDDRFEIGIGTYTASNNTLSRDTILQSSNNDNKISLQGVGIVFCVLPADRVVYKDEDNAVVFPTPFVFKRSDTGDYWQAYSTDITSRVASFYIDESLDPFWKIGFKNSNSDIVEPFYGYISACDGFVELKGNGYSILSIGDGLDEGLKVDHRYERILDLTKDSGTISVKNLDLNVDNTTAITNTNISSNVFEVQAGVGHVSDLQVWSISTDEIASLNQLGDFQTVGSIIAPSGRFNVIRFSDGTTQETAASGIGGESYDDTAISGYFESRVDSSDLQIIAVSGFARYYVDSQDHSAIAVSGWARDYVDSQDHSAIAVSGWAEATFLTQDDDSYVSGVATYASGLADQNVLDIATVSGLLSDAYDDTPISGYFESRVDFNESQITAVSGFAREYVDSQDHSAIAVSGWARDYVDSQDHSAIAVSGWARDYVDSQDHSAVLVSGALQTQITQNASDLSTVSGLLSTVGDRFTSDITVSLGGGKTFGRYENGDVIPSSGLKPSQVISLAVTEPIAPTASLTSSSAVDFNQVNVSITLNFSHTINSLGATVTSASLEFRRGNTGSWTVLSTSTSASSSYNHTFTDTAFNTAVLNYRYTVTDTAGATTTVTKDIYPDTYSAPSISFSVVAVSTTSPETNSSRERGNVNSNISGSINRNESYVDLISYTLQYSVNGGSWTDVGSAVSIGPGNSTISSTNHNPTSNNTATSIRYRVKVVDDYTTSYSSISTVSFGYLIFYGPSSSAPTTSSNVRALPSRLFTIGNNTFTLNTGSTEVNFTVAIPSTESISEVIDIDALNDNITSQYVNNAFNVDDAGGTAVSYNVYTMTLAIAYSSNHRHQVTKG